MTNNIKYRELGIAVVVAALFTATSASAALTVTIGGTSVLNEGIMSSVAGAVSTTFDGSLTNPLGYVGGNVVAGGVTNSAHAEPPNDTSNYFAVGPDNPTGNLTNSATITLTGLASYFGFYGGSPDTYNSVSFLNGANLVESFSGAQLASLASVLPDGNQAVASFWNFAAPSSADYFNKVEFSSTQNAFETDNHAVILAAVPEPETYVMMLAGLGLIGFMSRRRKTNA